MVTRSPYGWYRCPICSRRVEADTATGPRPPCPDCVSGLPGAARGAGTAAERARAMTALETLAAQGNVQAIEALERLAAPANV